MAAWLAYAATLPPHGTLLGILAAVGGFLGAIPGAILGAVRPGLRAPLLLATGAACGGVLGLVAGAIWFFDGAVLPVVFGGLTLSGGAVIIPLIAAGCALVAFAPAPRP